MLKRYSFKGVEYRVECFDHYPQHPSWYTHEDERDLRERCWGSEDLAGKVFLDCGAAFGAWTLAALAAGARRAVAWTPQHLPGEDAEIEVLSSSLERNGWLHRARLIGSALYDRPGFLNLASGQYSEGWSPEFDVVTPPFPRRTRGWLPEDGYACFWRECAPLDEHLRGTKERVDWVKVDVEGAEVEVLRGARRTLLEHRPRVVVEQHRYMRRGVAEECDAVMSGCGYRLEERVEKSADIWHGIYFPE